MSSPIFVGAENSCVNRSRRPRLKEMLILTFAIFSVPSPGSLLVESPSLWCALFHSIEIIEELSG
jgi:hypothetical protein